MPDKKAMPFGGKAVHFGDRTETVAEVFGKKPVSTTDMTKLLWAFIKKNALLK